MRRGMIISALFVFVTALFFLPVFTKGHVPIPLNLLVSYYSPWKNEGYKFANKPIGFDNVRQMLPYRHFSKEAVMNGTVPLWNPHIFAGSPHIAMLQPAFFYPGTLIDILLPLEYAWTIMVLIQPVVAGLLTYIFLRALRMSGKASLIGAVSFAFSGWMIAWWEEFLIVVHSIIWLPLALYGSLLIWQRKWLGFIWLTTALSLSVFAAFTQSTLYLGLTVIVWNLMLWQTHRDIKNQGTWLRNPWVSIVTSGIAALGITAIQWVPTLETYLLSPRASDDASYIFSGHLLPLTRLVTLFAPDYWGNPGTYNAFGNPGFYHERIIYLGLVPLFLALIALFSVKQPLATFWKFFTVITFSMVFAIPTSWIFHTLHIPLLSAMQPARIMMIVTFGASVLAAYGFDALIKTKSAKIMILPLLTIGLIATGAWGWLGWTYLQTHLCPAWALPPPLLCPAQSTTSLLELASFGTVTFRNLIIPSVGLLVMAGISVALWRKPMLFFSALAILHLSLMGYFAQKYLYFSETKNMYPVTPVIETLRQSSGHNRVWGYGNAAIESNTFSYFSLATPEGYAPFFPRQYGELMGAIEHNGIIQPSIARSDVTLKHADEVEKMTDNQFRLPMMSLLGVKYIMEAKNGEGKDRQKTEERFPETLFTLHWENENWRIWEYVRAYPRVFLADDVVVASGTADYTNILFRPDVSLRETIVLDMQPHLTITPVTGVIATSAASITSYSPNKVTIGTQHTAAAMLFLSDSYYPGWRAYIDQKETPIYRADYAFRAVAVPAGNHAVEFRYEPVSWIVGVIGSVSGLLLFGLLIWWHKNKL